MSRSASCGSSLWRSGARLRRRRGPCGRAPPAPLARGGSPGRRAACGTGGPVPPARADRRSCRGPPALPQLRAPPVRVSPPRVRFFPAAASKRPTGRTPGHPRGPVDPRAFDRRAAAALQRAPRIDVHGGPAPAAGVRGRAVRQRGPAAAHRHARHHRVMAGGRTVGPRLRGEHSARPVLRGELVDRPGPHHHLPHRAGRTVARRRVLSPAPTLAPTPSPAQAPTAAAMWPRALLRAPGLL